MHSSRFPDKSAISDRNTAIFLPIADQKSIRVSESPFQESPMRTISFAEIDSDLQPWGSKGAPKDDLRRLYDDGHVWVYGDFGLQFPPRPSDFE